MKKILLLLLVSFFTFPYLSAKESVNVKAFDLLNLDYKGLEKVKKYVKSGNTTKAAKELLKYYQSRTSVVNPDLDLQNVKISKTEQKWADDALEHVFFAHKGYQPSYFYGDDIDWTYWPIKDNELRWQLHRTKWWQPMGKAFFLTKDEKYAKEWVFQYMDWIKKNPLEDFRNRQQVGSDVESLPNSAFAWRPLEVSHRIQDQIAQFMLFIGSKHFTPEFLTHFLVNYDKHVNHILQNYSKQGNHLLFEAQRVLYAGTCFPEFKDAKAWRKSGIDILNREINTQVFADGGQFELDLGYHLAVINIFAKALRIAQMNHFEGEFPTSYSDIIHSMIVVVMNTYFPDYTNPMFSDAKLGSKQTLVRNYKEWAKLYPKDNHIKYFATQGKKGQAPSYLSKAFKESGFYVFRNGWDTNAIQMTLKAGPAAFWHNQPDNGTFELYVKGRNFFPDSGSYVYGGDAEVLKEREWFRQTRVHNTLTLDRANLNGNSKCIYWNVSDTLDVVKYENDSYENLSHTRTVYFVNKQFFVILDQVRGNAKGEVGIHYNMLEGKINFSESENKLWTSFDNNNLVIQVFGSTQPKLVKENGLVSYGYRQKASRDIFTFNIDKKDENQDVYFVTVLLPFDEKESKVRVEALKKEKLLQVSLDDKEFNLSTELNE